MKRWQENILDIEQYKGCLGGLRKEQQVRGRQCTLVVWVLLDTRMGESQTDTLEQGGVSESSKCCEEI